MDAIRLHTENKITTLTLNRVDKKNALTPAMYTTLVQALEQAKNAADVSVVVIQGSPLVFCAGNDIADLANQSAVHEDAPVWQFLHAISTFPKPLVAAVCGPAVGVGVTLLLHCDLVYAGDNAVFSLPFINLGLCPEAGSGWLLPQLMGHRLAAEALLLGEPFGVEHALDMGLVNRVVPPTEANQVAQAQARKLATKSLPSLIETKRLMKQPYADQLQVQMNAERKSAMHLLQQPAAQQAIAVFMGSA